MSDEMNKKKRRVWSSNDTRLLLQCYEIRKDEFALNRKKRLAYLRVLEDMRQIGLEDESLTAMSLESRIRVLKSGPSKFQPLMEDMPGILNEQREISVQLLSSDDELPETLNEPKGKCVVENTNVCRVCFVTDRETLSLDTNCLKYQDNNTLFSNVTTFLDCYKFVTKLEGELNEQCFNKLCLNCAYELTNAYKFMRKAQLAEEQYEKILNDNSTTQFTADPIAITTYKDAAWTDDYCMTQVAEVEETLESNEVEETLESNEVEENNRDQNLIENVCSLSNIEKYDEENKTLLKDENFSIEVEAHLEDKHNMKEHKRSELKSSTTCFLCNKKLSSLRSMRIHVEGHKELRKNYFCDICDKSFILKESMLIHKDRHSAKFQCEICDKVFKKKSSLDVHMQKHENDIEGTFPCEKCGKIYTTKKSLVIHQNCHMKKTLPCEFCDKKFISKKELIIHQRFHTKDFPFVCDMCGQKFALNCHLKVHLKLKHQGMKIVCLECGKTFSSRGGLREHYYVHTGKFPFPCCYCKRSYTKKYKYKFHLKNTHKIEPTDEEVEKSKAKCIPTPIQRLETKWVQIKDDQTVNKI